MPTIKNIIIFVVIAAIFGFVYFYFIKPSPAAPALVSSSPAPVAPSGTGAVKSGAATTQEFLTVLLNVKNIKLSDTIFSDAAFTTLRDSSITLTPDGTEGRVNPFAPLGSDAVAPITPTAPTTP